MGAEGKRARAKRRMRWSADALRDAGLDAATVATAARSGHFAGKDWCSGESIEGVSLTDNGIELREDTANVDVQLLYIVLSAPPAPTSDAERQLRSAVERERVYTDDWARSHPHFHNELRARVPRFWHTFALGEKGAFPESRENPPQTRNAQRSHSAQRAHIER